MKLRNIALATVGVIDLVGIGVWGFNALDAQERRDNARDNAIVYENANHLYKDAGYLGLAAAYRAEADQAEDNFILSIGGAAVGASEALLCLGIATYLNTNHRANHVQTQANLTPSP